MLCFTTNVDSKIMCMVGIENNEGIYSGEVSEHRLVNTQNCNTANSIKMACP